MIKGLVACPKGFFSKLPVGQLFQALSTWNSVAMFLEQDFKSLLALLEVVYVTVSTSHIVPVPPVESLGRVQQAERGVSGKSHPHLHVGAMGQFFPVSAQFLL